MERRVDVVDQIITAIDSVADGLPHARCLKPWLAWRIREGRVDRLRVSAEERIPRANLIEHDEQIFSWIAIEAWDVSTSKWVPCDTTLHDHCD